MIAKLTNLNPEIEKNSPELEVIKLRNGYICDVIGDDWKKWDYFRSIILECPTGSGKTTFIENCLIEDAISKSKKILIVSNRVALDIGIKKRIMQAYNIENVWNDLGLRKQSEFGEHIVVMTYQKLFANLKKMRSREFEYVVFDEVHYLMMDAGFTAISGYILKNIPRIFNMTKRIYISATIDEVLPYICRSELNDGANTRMSLMHQIGGGRYLIDDVHDEMQLERANSEMRFASKCPTPILYKMNADMAAYNLFFFDDFEKVKAELISSPHKSIIFVDSKEFGMRLHEELKDSMYIDSRTKENDTESFLKLIENEAFKEKFLITTSVFINGSNIIDKAVKNVVIFNLDPCDIKQALGRKRIIGDEKNLKVFLQIPTPRKISNTIKGFEQILNLTSLTKKELSQLILNSSAEYELIKRIIYASPDGTFSFNDLSIQHLLNGKIYFENLLEILKKGPSAYARQISKSLSIPFRKTTLKLISNPKSEMTALLDKFVETSPMNIDEFTNASIEFNNLRKRLKLITPEDNFGKKRNPLMENALNQRLKFFKFKYKVEKSDDLYSFKKY